MPYETVVVAGAIVATTQIDPAVIASLVKRRLAEYGITSPPADADIALTQSRAELRILHFINLSRIPVELTYALADEVTADIIEDKMKKITVTAEGSIENGSGALKEIREGDRTYAFETGSSSGSAIGSPQELAIRSLREAREQWYHYRSLPW